MTADEVEAAFKSENADERRVSQVRFEGTDFRGRELSGGMFDSCTFVGAKFDKAEMVWTVFAHCKFEQVSFLDANFYRTRFSQCAEFIAPTRVREGESALFEPPQERFDPPWTDIWFSWDRLGGIGRLPIFSASVFGFTALSTIFYLMALWNVKSEAYLSHYPETQTLLPYIKLHAPKLSWLWLVSNVLLMAGATIFALACPQKVKDYTRITWKHNANTGPDHVYSYASWALPGWRVACGLCFGLGGAGVAYFLLTKLTRLFEFALAG